MKRLLSPLPILICFMALGATAQAQSLTIGYTNCLAVDSFSPSLMSQLAQANWYFAHASVGECIAEGVTNLHLANPGFYEFNMADVTNVPPGSTTAGVIYNDYRGNLAGNGDYSGDWQWKVAYFQTAVSNGWHYPKVNIALNKFCFIDIWYATDSSDVATLLNTYLNSMLSLEAAYPQTVFVYATMPITTLNYSYESLDSEPNCDYWRNVFNNNLRSWCASNNRVLFDIADIEAYDYTNGNLVTFTYDGSTCQELWAGDNQGGDQCCGEVGDGAHPTNYGAEELLARGFYAIAAATLSRWSSGATNPPPAPAPVAYNDSYSFTENATLTIAAPGVLANDTDNTGYSLTAVLVNGPAHGALNFNPNGGFIYTPATNFSGADSFTYYATDGKSNSATATVTLTGLAAGVLFSDNFARSSNPGPLAPWLEESGSWTVSSDMMQANDSSEGYGIVYITNSWSNYTVQASIRFSTVDGYGGGISGRLNPATGARYAAWVYPEGSPASGPMIRLVKFQGWTSWSYQGSSYMPMQQTTLPSVGTNWHTLQMSFQGNQIIVAYDGTQYIQVADAESTPYADGAVGLELYEESTPYTLAIENVLVTGSVTAPAPDPVANNDSYQFTENTPLTVPAPGVLANDTDTAGYTLTAVLATGPSQGTLTLNPNGSFSYTPATNFSGTDSFTYYAMDGSSNSSIAKVTLTGSASGVVFSDNFSRATNPGPLAPWLAESGSWTVTSGRLEGNSSANSYGAAYITNSWSNYTVQANIQFSTASGYGAGISGRLNPATGARYAAWVYPEGSPAKGPLIRLVKFQSWTTWSYQGADYTPIQQASLTGVSTNWHTLQLSFQGNQMTVSFDGNQVLSAADGEATPYSSGAVGFDLYTGSTPYTVNFENASVTQ
jgi:Bacterial Ig domain